MKKWLLCLITTGLLCSSISVTSALESTIKGDINSDGILNVMDAVRFQKWMIGTLDIDISEIKEADLNNDGKVNIADFCLLKNALLYDPEIDTSNPPAPVSPVTQTIGLKNTDELTDLLKNYDLNDYNSVYHDSLQSMFERFNQDGYIYHFAENMNAKSKIELIDNDRPIILIPYFKYEDIGIYYNVSYKGKNYQIRYYLTDPEYSDSDMCQYLENRFEIKNYKVTDNGYVISEFKTGDDHDPVAYCKIDEDHYCEVRSYDTEDDLMELLKDLKHEKIFIHRPLIEINEGLANDNGYIWNIITEEGSRYSAPNVMFGSATTYDMINYIISEGEKELFIKDADVLQSLSDISKNAAKYTDCKWTSVKYKGTKECDISLSLLYYDENGKMEQLYFCYIGNDNVEWLDNEEIQILVKDLIKCGYIQAIDFWNYTDDKVSDDTPAEKEKLTIAKVLELTKIGADITWDDLNKYEGRMNNDYMWYSVYDDNYEILAGYIEESKPSGVLLINSLSANGYNLSLMSNTCEQVKAFLNYQVICPELQNISKVVISDLSPTGEKTYELNNSGIYFMKPVIQNLFAGKDENEGWKTYNGKCVRYEITYSDGRTSEILFMNPYIVIDGKGYITTTEVCDSGVEFMEKAEKNNYLMP